MSNRSSENVTKASGIDPSLFQGVNVDLEVKLGEVRATVAEVLSLKPDKVLKLDTGLDALVDLRFNGTTIARGEIVAVDNQFAIRLIEVGPDAKESA